MWNRIIQEIKRAKDKNDKQKSLAEQIAALNEKIGREGNSRWKLSLAINIFLA